MDDTSGYSRFKPLFEAALMEYEAQTRTKLVDHPFYVKLNTCNSVQSITTTVLDQAQAFRRFRGDDGKVMKCLKGAIHALHTLSTSGVLGGGISLVRRIADPNSRPLFNLCYIAVPTCERNICWNRYPAHSKYYPALQMVPMRPN